MSHVRLNIRELLRFYDDEPEARRHSNAVKAVAGEELGLALFQHYLDKEIGANPVRICKPCTTKGAWLDGWIKVTDPKTLLYQIEVKSWSMHGYGSKKQQLAVDATSDQLKNYKINTWKHYWEAGTFKPKGLKKVLKKMTLPENESGPQEPVACIWAAVHPHGARDEFFTVPVNDPGSDFNQVHVFSMSAYLRGLLTAGTATLTLNLPDATRRIQYLSSLFPTGT